MHVTTSLPFPHLTFKHWGLDDREKAVVIVKGTFGIRADGSVGVLKDQPPIVEVDEYFGEVEDSSLQLEQELAPAKMATDVIIHGIARSPSVDDPAPAQDWPVAVEVIGADGAYLSTYEFRVRGACQWEPKGKGKKRKWVLSEPEATLEVPLRYEHAYGGTLAGEDDVQIPYAYNPAGMGHVDDNLLAQDDPIPAPQIGDLAEFMSGDINTEMTVHGVGPVAKWWLPRRSSAGTFDATWKATRQPRMPKDYSFQFWNSAHKRLQIEAFLQGGETIRLRGFQHSLEPMEIKLDPLSVAVHKGLLH